MASDPANPLLDFTLHLYKQLLVETKSKAHIFYSPFSIAAALSMTLAGARHRTATQIQHTMRLEGSTVHKHFADVLPKIDGYAPNVTLQVTNRLYSDESFHVLPAYTFLLEETYKTTLKSFNCKKNTEAARLQINAWVQEVTRSKIKDLLPEGTIEPGTALVIVNAVYFKGLWKCPFDPQLTRPKKFHVTKYHTETVDMMYKKAKFRINRSNAENASVLEIPYKGKKTSMVIILPDRTNGLPAVEKMLTPSMLRKILGDLVHKRMVELSLPRLKLEQETDLKKTLQAMGIHDLFTDCADLSGVSGGNDLRVSTAVHKAFVEVNKEGTEAAAASAVGMELRSGPIPFNVDHPFLFVIRSRDPDVSLLM